MYHHYFNKVTLVICWNDTRKALGLQHRNSLDLEKEVPTMNFRKLFIFTLAVVALSGFSTFVKGVNAASVEDRAKFPDKGSEGETNVRFFFIISMK